MFRIKTLNKISPAGLSVLDQTRFSVSDDVENEDGILVRSADMHEYQFPDSLRAIARAGAGTNNIPIDRCSEAGIVVFNTPGANANAVKELALCALLLASRKNTAGAEWGKAQAGAGAGGEEGGEKVEKVKGESSKQGGVGSAGPPRPRHNQETGSSGLFGSFGPSALFALSGPFALLGLLLLIKKSTEMGNKDKQNISIILKVIVAIATAILGAIGVNAAI